MHTYTCIHICQMPHASDCEVVPLVRCQGALTLTLTLTLGKVPGQMENADTTRVMMESKRLQHWAFKGIMAVWFTLTANHVDMSPSSTACHLVLTTDFIIIACDRMSSRLPATVTGTSTSHSPSPSRARCSCLEAQVCLTVSFSTYPAMSAFPGDQL